MYTLIYLRFLSMRQKDVQKRELRRVLRHIRSHPSFFSMWAIKRNSDNVILAQSKGFKQ